MRSIEPAGPRDEDLLRLVGAGDEQAFRELFSRYASVAHALAFRLVRQAQVAEEIGAYAVVYQTLPDLLASVTYGRMCSACFSGDYPTGDITHQMLHQIETERMAQAR